MNTSVRIRMVKNETYHSSILYVARLEQSMNDKNKADHGKEPISLVPTRIIWEIAKVRDYGINVKYPETGRDGWKEIDIERIRDAMLRHCLRYIEDPHGVDEESGLSHLAHLATNVAFLCEMEAESKNETQPEEQPKGYTFF